MANFAGVDAIISNAALFTMKKTSWDDFYLPNKVGTENVFNSAKKAGVNRLIQVSSVAVYIITAFGRFVDTPVALLVVKHSESKIHVSLAVRIRPVSRVKIDEILIVGCFIVMFFRISVIV